MISKTSISRTVNRCEPVKKKYIVCQFSNITKIVNPIQETNELCFFFLLQTAFDTNELSMTPCGFHVRLQEIHSAQKS
jgi:hypothetical protein